MNKNAMRVLGGVILTTLLAALGLFMVPAHWNSIWMDTGFGGWVAPIANRITPELRLYNFGLHSPMPPIPFVLMRVLYPDGAYWLHESLLNFTFQAGTILLLYWAFSRRIGVAMAFATALAIMPVFFSLNKTILYDSMAQFLVACIGVSAVACSDSRTPAQSATGKGPLWPMVLLASFLALLFLTKQSTGAGAAFGAMCLLARYPRAEASNYRFTNVVVTLALTVVAIFVILGLLTPWVNFSNCLHDIFLAGSQPKGGLPRLLASIGWALMEVAVAVGLTVFIVLLFSLGFGQGWPRLLSGQLPRSAAKSTTGLFWLASGAAVTGFSALWLYASLGGSGAIIQGFHLDSVGSMALNLSLLLLLLHGATVMLRKIQPEITAEGNHSEAKYALVFFCAALGHNLSAVVLRWSHDNNPLIFSALALLLGRCVRFLPATAESAGFRNLLPAGVASLLILALWVPCAGMITMVVHCTEHWPEVRYLDKARLRPDAAGMREVVTIVRSLVPQDSPEETLLLPNDPGIEAWFDRKRPPLSSAIIFVDQYWDRYVADDFAQLTNHPPKVIVIGPRNYWRQFGWHWRKQWGAERLIDLVQTQLLPHRYNLHKAREIKFRGGRDFMDIYVRKEAAP